MLKYLIVPKPKNDESISSFILRLSKDNLYDRTKWIFQNIGLTKSHQVNHLYNCNNNHFSFQKLANMTGLDKEDIVKLTFLSILGDYNDSEDFIDITLGSNIHRLNIKFCPDCLKDGLYFRKIWDLHQYSICHLHKHLLVNKCTTCGWKFNFKSLSDFECNNCGNHFSSMKSGIYLNKIEVSNFIFYKMNKELSEQKLNKNYLNTINFKEALYILTNLSSKMYQKKPSNDCVEDRIRKNNLLVEVFEAFNDFPNSFYNFLEEYWNKYIPDPNKKLGIQRSFGHLFEDIDGKYKQKESLHFLYKFFNNYIKYHWKGSILSSRGVNHEYLNEEWIFRHEAREILGVTIYTLDNLIANGDIITKKVKRGKEHILVNKESILAFKELKEVQRKNNENLKKYYLTNPQVNALIKLGVLKKGNVNNGFKKVDSELLISFFNSINQKSQKTIELNPGKKFINFNQLVRKYCVSGKGIFGVLSDIMNDNLKIYSNKENIMSLSCIFFERRDVDQLEINRSFKTRKEIAKELLISQNQLKYLLDKKFLKSKDVDGKAVVTDENIKDFKARYMLFKDIKEFLLQFEDNMHNFKVNEYVDFLDIEPINSKVKKAHPYIYDKKNTQVKILNYFSKNLNY